MAKRFLTSNEAAEFLGVSRSSLGNWVRQGLLSGGATPGGHYRFTENELVEFASSRGLQLPPRELSGAVKILIIEDDEPLREFIRDALSDFDCEIREAADGVEGAITTGTWRPSLIVLDIRMPKMNGMDFLRSLRENPDTSATKVLVASAHLTPEIRAELEELDADMILDKPIRLARLTASVQQMLNLRLK